MVWALLGRAAVSGVGFGLDLGDLGEQVGDALGSDRGLVVHAARAERPRPQGAPLLVGDDGGLLGVHLLLAGDERLPAGLVRAGAADLDLGALAAEIDSAGRVAGA